MSMGDLGHPSLLHDFHCSAGATARLAPAGDMTDTGQ